MASAGYWRLVSEEISKCIKDVGGDPGFVQTRDKEDGRNQQFIWKCPRSPHSHVRTRLWLFSFQCRWRSHTNSQSSSYRFLFKVHGYYYSMSSVGVSAPLHPYPPSLPKATGSHTIASPDFLFYLVSPELIQPPYKIAHLTSHIPFWSHGGHHTYDGGRSLLPDPPHRSFLTISTHSFLSIFPRSPQFLYHMACHFRVNSFLPGICLYIFPSRMPPSPTPTIRHLLCDLSRWRPLEFGCSDNSLRM